MMNKRRLKIISLAFLIVFTFLATVQITNINARENSLGEDTSVKLKAGDFITSAILSLDSEVSEKEQDQDYIVNLSNSSVTAMPYDLSFVDPDTVMMHIIGLIIDIFEKFGFLISLIVLIFYNVASSTFWQTIINTIFSIFDKALFDWTNVNSWFYRLVILFGLVAIIRKIFSSMKHTFNLKQALSIIIQVAASCFLIIVIAQNGKPVINYIENMANSSISTSFNFLSDQYSEDVPLEINVKNQMFDIMQKQGFCLRHFGVTTASQIPNEYKGTYKGKDYKVDVSGEDRLSTLLNDPSTDNAETERKEYGNDQIGYSSAQCGMILGGSIIFLVHRALMGFVLGVACIGLFSFTFFKEASLSLSIYGLVFSLFKNELKVASSWFVNRLKWMLMFIVITLAFNMFLSFMVLMVNNITSEGLLFLLVFDSAIVIAMIYIIKNWSKIWQKITSDFGISAESGIFDIGKAILNGNVDPGFVYNNRKERQAQDASADDDPNQNQDEQQSNSSLNNVQSDDELADQEEQDELSVDSNINDENVEQMEGEFDIEGELEQQDDSSIESEEKSLGNSSDDGVFIDNDDSENSDTDLLDQEISDLEEDDSLSSISNSDQDDELADQNDVGIDDKNDVQRVLEHLRGLGYLSEPESIQDDSMENISSDLYDQKENLDDKSSHTSQIKLESAEEKIEVNDDQKAELDDFIDSFSKEGDNENV